MSKHKYVYIVFYASVAAISVYAFVMAVILLTSVVYYDYSNFGYYPSIGLGFENAFLFLLMLVNCLYLGTFFKLVFNLRAFYII